MTLWLTQAAGGSPQGPLLHPKMSPEGRAVLAVRGAGWLC